MGRQKPTLAGWDAKRLVDLKTMDPKSWVQAVLATWDPRWLSRAVEGQTESLRMFRSWSYGEIREAISRGLRMRCKDPSGDRAAKIERNADAITWRGLAALRTEGGVEKKGGLYRLTGAWDSAALMRSVLDGLTIRSNETRPFIRAEAVSEPKGKPRVNRWYKMVLRIVIGSKRFPDCAISYQFPVRFRLKPADSGVTVEIVPPPQL